MVKQNSYKGNNSFCIVQSILSDVSVANSHIITQHNFHTLPEALAKRYAGVTLCTASYRSFQKHVFVGEMSQSPAQMTHVVSLEKVVFSLVFDQLCHVAQFTTDIT